MIDALEAVLARSLARYETGDATMRMPGDLDEHGWFQLDDATLRHIADRTPGADVEWLETVAASLMLRLVDQTGTDWAEEAMRHVAQLIAVRLARVEELCTVWGAGVNVLGDIDGLLGSGFPNAAVLIEQH